MQEKVAGVIEDVKVKEALVLDVGLAGPDVIVVVGAAAADAVAEPRTGTIRSRASTTMPRRTARPLSGRLPGFLPM